MARGAMEGILGFCVFCVGEEKYAIMKVIMAKVIYLPVEVE